MFLAYSYVFERLILYEESLVEEWVATSNFRPSNRILIDKIFSTVLDRKAIDPKLWLSIKAPVLILHGGTCILLAPFVHGAYLTFFSPRLGNDVPYPPEVAQDHYDSMPNADRELHMYATLKISLHLLHLTPHILSIPDAPHFLSYTHPAQTNFIMANFFDKITGIDSRSIALQPLKASPTPIRPDKYTLKPNPHFNKKMNFFSRLMK